jgi:serine/threonine protein kinase
LNRWTVGEEYQEKISKLLDQKKEVRVYGIVGGVREEAVETPEPAYSFLEFNFEFVTESPIGQGGYGKVFHVRHRADKKEYALKYFGLLE